MSGAPCSAANTPPRCEIYSYKIDFKEEHPPVLLLSGSATKEE